MPTKKSIKKTAKNKTTPVVEVKTPDVVAAPHMTMPTAPKLNPKVLATALVLVGVGLITYKLGPWFIPAIVDKTPITRWQMHAQLDKLYGEQVLDDMINEQVLNVAIKKANVVVEDAKFTAQLAKLEQEFESSGGLDAALEMNGLDRGELEKQIRTQLAVEEILKDQISVSSDEAQAYFDQNATTLFKDKKYDEVAEQVTLTLQQDKLRSAFATWFAEVKKDIGVKNFTLKN